MIPVIPENFIMSGNWPTLSTAFQGLFRCLDISYHLHSRFSVSGKGHTQDPLRRHFIQHMAALSTTGKKLNIRKKSQKKLQQEYAKHIHRIGFRLAGKFYLDAMPGQYEVVRQLLGHKNLKTTTQCYASLNSRQAQKLHDNVITATRHRLSLGTKMHPEIPGAL